MPLLAITDIVERDDLYPRIEHDQTKAQQYSECIEHLPPIEVNQNNELIDGKHRLIAHRLANREQIAATVTQTNSEAHLLALAVERNAAHGLQLADADKRKMAVKFYTDELSWKAFTKASDKAQLKADLANLLKCSTRQIRGWLSDIDQSERKARTERIRQMYFQCYTSAEIGEAVGVDEKQVRNEVSGLLEDVPKLLKVTFSDEEWKPPIADVWAFAKKTNATAHFGNTEQRIADNLLWLYTDPLDIVVDPFGGGGSTLDVCMKRGRRCWISDRKPAPGLEKRIRTLDVCESLPPLNKRWSEVSLVYLDPPYWRQAAGEYSDDAEDLANMSIGDFTQSMVDVIKSFAKKMRSGSHIAMIIQPTHWRSDPKGKVEDHVLDIRDGLKSSKQLQYERRFSCPYSTEQCTPQMVDWAKENRNPLVISRELIVWKVS